MNNITKSAFNLLNRVAVFAIVCLAFVVWQLVALVNFLVFSASILAIIIYSFVPLLNGNWSNSFSHIFAFGINTQTWQIVSVHGWFYSFLFSALAMKYFPIVGMLRANTLFDNIKPRQKSETKYVFVSPPKIG